jgi:hypothetical protein
MSKPLQICMLALGLLLSPIAWSEVTSFSEPAGNVSFVQYTGTTALFLWRMPSPGTSVFPGGNCKWLGIPGAVEVTNRFMSLYLFLKANGGNYFISYDTATCLVDGYGMNG